MPGRHIVTMAIAAGAMVLGMIAAMPVASAAPAAGAPLSVADARQAANPAYYVSGSSTVAWRCKAWLNASGNRVQLVGESWLGHHCVLYLERVRYIGNGHSRDAGQWTLELSGTGKKQTGWIWDRGAGGYCVEVGAEDDTPRYGITGPYWNGWWSEPGSYYDYC